MLDKLIDTTLGGAGLCGENRLLLMDVPPAGTARENKLPRGPCPLPAGPQALCSCGLCVAAAGKKGSSTGGITGLSNKSCPVPSSTC